MPALANEILGLFQIYVLLQVCHSSLRGNDKNIVRITGKKLLQQSHYVVIPK